MPFSLLLILNLAFTAMLSGLIWMVQLVHYPAFLHVGKENCFAFQQHHTRSISRLVVPLMVAELVFALWLLFWPMTFFVMEYLNYFAFACLLLIWLVTFLKAVPYHS